LDLLRIARRPTGIVHLDGALDLRRQLPEGRREQSSGQLSGKHGMGRLRHQKAGQAHIPLRCFYLGPG
jgi:hypothetical protein